MFNLAVVVLWILLGVGLFGLGRLAILKRGLESDWGELVRFGKSLPSRSPDWKESPEALAKMLDAAPPGLFLPPVAEPDAPPPANSQIFYERLRLYQATLQSEMAWFAHRIANPIEWLRSGLCGLLLAPLGALLPTGTVGRARRRSLESAPEFQRLVSAVVGLMLFVLAADLVALGVDVLPALGRLLAK